MADLLECLIQIKGVAGTPLRLAARARACVEQGSEATAREVVGRLAVAEKRFAACLHLMLSQEKPTLPPLETSPLESQRALPLAVCLQQFQAAREEVVRTLEACSAEDLNRVGIEPSRGATTVADLVAIMLAHDTDQLGRLISCGRAG